MNWKKVIMKGEEVRKEGRKRRERKIGGEGESEGEGKRELGERSEGKRETRKKTYTQSPSPTLTG